jgi:hypothetical protein
MRELFKKKTHIDPDYFLEMILRFLGELDDSDQLGKITESLTVTLNDQGIKTGTIHVTKNFIQISKLS